MNIVVVRVSVAPFVVFVCPSRCRRILPLLSLVVVALLVSDDTFGFVVLVSVVFTRAITTVINIIHMCIVGGCVMVVEVRSFHVTMLLCA